jgi:nucleotide-binding universal stress UspA family protein
MVIEQARSRDDEIRILHVVEPPSLLVAREMGGYDPALDDVWEAELKRAQQSVGDAAERMRAKGLRVSTAVESGLTPIRILDIAAQWPADPIVLGWHGRRGLDRFLMGSVSEAVARHVR